MSHIYNDSFIQCSVDFVHLSTVDIQLIVLHSDHHDQELLVPTPIISHHHLAMFGRRTFHGLQALMLL